MYRERGFPASGIKEVARNQRGKRNVGGGVCKEASSCRSIKLSVIYRPVILRYHPIIHMSPTHDIQTREAGGPSSISYPCHLDPRKGGPSYPPNSIKNNRVLGVKLSLYLRWRVQGEKLLFSQIPPELYPEIIA